MSERFDDIIRKQLEGLESPVPPDMFDAIRNQPDVSDAMFDAGLRNKLQPAESLVAGGLFDKINAKADLNNAPFDETILQKLNTYPSAVPADMWERIMQNKRRRRPVAWWWVAAGLVLLFSGSTWYAVEHSGTKNPTAGKTELADKSKIPNNTPASPDGISTDQKTVFPFTTDTSSEAIANTQHSPVYPQDVFTKKLPLSSDKILHSNKRAKSIAQKQQEPDALRVNDSRNKRRTIRLSEKAVKNDVADNTPDFILNSGGNEKEMPVENAPATLNALRLAIAGQLRNAAKLTPGQLLKAKPRLPVIPCPANGDEGPNDWYVDVYTSAFVVKKNISDNASGKNAKTGFDSTLHQQLSYNAGISLVKNMGQNILLKTGVQYSRINESFRLTRINERKLVTIISVRTVIIAPGDTVYIRDTSVTETIGTIQRRKQNTYQQWDVPVIIGYEFGGEDIRLNANAGIIANIRSSYSGEMLADTSLQIINAKNYNGKPVYKTNVGFSLYAGLSIIKPIGERTSLLIEPYARIGLQKITSENAWFRQKNSAAGISVGFRYQLNGSGQRR